MAVLMKNKPRPKCGITKRLLGRILVDGEFVTPDVLEAALGRQKETNEQLGEILLGMGVINSVDLKAALSVQRDFASPEDSVKAAAGVRELLAQLFIKVKRISAEQVEAAVKEQRETGEKIGEILVRRGLVSENELNIALAFQKHQGGEACASDLCRLGEILVATEQITRDQLDAVLANQKITKKKVGELLIEAGYVEPHQVAYGLKLQQRLVTAALIAALSMANAWGVREAFADSPSGPALTAKIAMTATVLEHTSMSVLDQVRELVVTNADISRGYVEMSAASRIQVKSNNPAGYLLAFEVMNGPAAVFNSVNVTVNGREVRLSPGGGWVPQPFIRGGVKLDLNYRFVLSRDAQPGTYNWPIMISVLRR